MWKHIPSMKSSLAVILRCRQVGTIPPYRLALLIVFSFALADLCSAQTRFTGTWAYTFSGGTASGGPNMSNVTAPNVNPFSANANADGVNPVYTVSATGPTSVKCVYTPGTNDPPVLATIVEIKMTTHCDDGTTYANDGPGA
jgi:hypothetical protein